MARISRRHALRRVGIGDAREYFPRHHTAFGNVEAKVRHAVFRVGSVTGEAVIGKDRAYFAIEIDLTESGAREQGNAYQADLHPKGFHTRSRVKTNPATGPSPSTRIAFSRTSGSRLGRKISTAQRSGSISHPNRAPFSIYSRILSRSVGRRSLCDRSSTTKSGHR